MTWYVTDLARYRTERELLDALAARAEWFAPIGWRVDDKMRLILDAEITTGVRIYPVFLRYPGHFPHTPPSVFPRGDATRWSNHQFGPGGELCLEYGPDNWTPDMTGAQMIESAERLLSGENPAPGEQATVASRHADSLGQRLRVEFARLFVTRNAGALLATLPINVALRGNVVSTYRKSGSTVVYFIDKITLPSGESWQDNSVPPWLPYEVPERPATIFKLPADAATPPTDDRKEFIEYCDKNGLTFDTNYVVIIRGGDIRGFVIYRDSDTFIAAATIPSQPEAQRLDSLHAQLGEKRVALIGCGSLGGKIGVTLARSGVGSFLLIDDDVMTPDNLVRNDLDWRDVGAHKADSVARRIQFVSPTAVTQTRKIQLAGQESGESADTALSSLAECDLIIDATANPNVLNLMGAVAETAKKLILWAEVFGGGIGGLIARYRPEHEPPPQYMRRAIENWFAERGATPVRATRDYGTGAKGAPLVADDADVTAIAGPAARMAIDLLLGRDPSLFPYSVYAIGLAPGSVFTHPFQTFPIEIGQAPVAEKRLDLSKEETAEEIARIIKLFTHK